MADRDPSVPQVNDPELETELIRVLSIIGPVGKLNLLDLVIPTVSLGSVVQQTVAIRQPSFRSTDLFSAGGQVAAAANFVHADTLALPAGIYDVIYNITDDLDVPSMLWAIEHRDAANAVTLSSMQIVSSRSGAAPPFQLTLGYELALNERLRIQNLVAFAAGKRSSASIFARVRT